LPEYFPAEIIITREDEPKFSVMEIFSPGNIWNFRLPKITFPVENFPEFLVSSVLI